MKYLLLKVSKTQGLGDSILALFKALAYAKLSNRILCVDWRGGMYGMPKDVNIFDRIFEVTGIPYVDKIPDNRSVHPSIWKNNIDKSFDQIIAINNDRGIGRKSLIKKYSFDVSNLDYQEDILIMWDFEGFEILEEALIEKGIVNKASSSFNMMGQIFDQFLSFKEEPALHLNKNWNKIVPASRNSRIIGAHVRDTQESMDCYGLVRTKRYYEAIDKLMEQDPNIAFIFLATDNEKVQEKFIARYGDMVLFKQKWFDDPGDPIHLSLEKCPDKWENMLDALFDMFALSRCDYLLRRKETSFSKVSQSIGLIDDKNVVIFNKEYTMKQKIRNKFSLMKNQFTSQVSSVFR